LAAPFGGSARKVGGGRRASTFDGSRVRRKGKRKGMMMKLAVLSDVHGNLDAFKAALADAEALGVEKFVCLGDLGSFDCVDLAIKLRDEGKLEACLLGNGDSLDATQFVDATTQTPLPEDAVFWAPERLETALTAQDAARWAFLGEIPRVYKKGEFLFAHGSPRKPLDEYVNAVDVADVDKMTKLFALTPRYCFQGHTHVPGVFVEEEDGSHSYFSASELEGGVFALDGRKLMANVGSVGEPRDGGPSSYVVVYCGEDGVDDKIEYRRLSLVGAATTNA
jgi:predicted phosphodiesterase